MTTKHECENLLKWEPRGFREIIKGATYLTGEWTLVDQADLPGYEKTFPGISHCPFCGKELP